MESHVKLRTDKSAEVINDRTVESMSIHTVKRCIRKIIVELIRVNSTIQVQVGVTTHAFPFVIIAALGPDGSERKHRHRQCERNIKNSFHVEHLLSWVFKVMHPGSMATFDRRTTPHHLVLLEMLRNGRTASNCQFLQV